MEGIQKIGIDIILWLQGLGSWLTTPMRLITFLGNEQFFLLVAPIVYWCWDATLGLRLALFLMISGGLNGILKILFHGTRPYWLDTRVQSLASETSFGVPSGHAQNSVVVWGTLAHRFRTKLGWGIAIALMFLIGLSRLYLAVHLPHDVLVGWLIGILLLWAFIRLSEPIATWIKRLNIVQQVSIAFLASLLLILLGYLAKLSLGGWTLPPEWVQNARAAFPDEPITPLSLSGLISNAGAFFGLAAGAAWLARLGGFNAKGAPHELVFRYILGLIGVFIVWYGLGKIVPRGEQIIPYIFYYIRYALVGVWITGIAPFLFIKIKIARPA